MKKSLFLLALLPALAAPAWAQKMFIDSVGAGGYSPPLPPMAASQSAMLPTVPPTLPHGVYVHVIDGQINLLNAAGQQQVLPGQFGFTASPGSPPVMLAANPGMQFSQPPAFTTSSPVVAAANTNGFNAQGVDCTVR